MNSALELHDSKIAAITRRGLFVCVDFKPAYFHWSPGQPGRDPGEGWNQDARLWLEEAELIGLGPELPAEVMDGELKVGTDVHSNTVPVPFHSVEPVELLLAFSQERRVSVIGRGAWLELVGDPRYVDEFRP
jgi:hypothetical protein